MKTSNKRKQGTGNVIVNGKPMTTDRYKNAIVKVLKQKDWLTTPEIIKLASEQGLCEGENYPRKAVAHPIYKILSIMFDEDITRVITRVKSNFGEWEYKLTKPNVIYHNGFQCFKVEKPNLNLNTATV